MVYSNLENGVKVGDAGARELDEGENAQDPGYGEQADHQQHSHCYFAAKTENGDVSFSRGFQFYPFPNLKLRDNLFHQYVFLLALVLGVLSFFLLQKLGKVLNISRKETLIANHQL